MFTQLGENDWTKGSMPGGEHRTTVVVPSSRDRGGTPRLELSAGSGQPQHTTAPEDPERSLGIVIAPRVEVTVLELEVALHGGNETISIA